MKMANLKFYWSLFLLLLSGLVVSCSLSKPIQQREYRKGDYIAEVQKKVSAYAKKKYGLVSAGFGCAALDEVKKIFVTFDLNRITTKEEIRRMVVDCTQQMVAYVQESDGIQPYLLPEGFNEKNVHILIIVQDGRKEVCHPDIGLASIKNGKLAFKTYPTNFNETFQYHTKVYETYDEAVSLLQSDNNDTISKPTAK